MAGAKAAADAIRDAIITDFIVDYFVDVWFVDGLVVYVECIVPGTRKKRITLHDLI